MELGEFVVGKLWIGSIAAIIVVYRETMKKDPNDYAEYPEGGFRGKDQREPMD